MHTTSRRCTRVLEFVLKREFTLWTPQSRPITAHFLFLIRDSYLSLSSPNAASSNSLIIPKFRDLGHRSPMDSQKTPMDALKSRCMASKPLGAVRFDESELLVIYDRKRRNFVIVHSIEIYVALFTRCRNRLLCGWPGFPDSSVRVHQMGIEGDIIRSSGRSCPPILARLHRDSLDTHWEARASDRGRIDTTVARWDYWVGHDYSRCYERADGRGEHDGQAC